MIISSSHTQKSIPSTLQVCEKLNGGLLKGNLGEKLHDADIDKNKQNPKLITINKKEFRWDYYKMHYGCLSKDTTNKSVKTSYIVQGRIFNTYKMKRTNIEYINR